VGPALESAAGKLLGRPTRTPDLSLRDFIRQGWHVPEPQTPFVDGWHLGAICEHLEAITRGEIRNLILNMPPRHMKSMALVFWMVWEWTFQPWVRWLFSSYDGKLSIRDSLKCRRLIQSPWYQERWGHVYRLTGDQNTKGRFENDQTGYRIATSVDGAATGEGGDRIIVDDPHNVREADSDDVRESAITWWRESMSSRGNDPKTVAKLIVMQRIHEKDLSGTMLELGGYDHLMLPAEYEPARAKVTSLGWADPRTKAGELLWPDRFGPPEIAALKLELGSYGAAGQLQQAPAPAAGGIVKKEWWRFYETTPPVFNEEWISWDMAFKGKDDDADYVVGTVWGRLGAQFYLRDLVRAQLEFNETQKGTVVLAKTWPRIPGKLVEDKANGPAIISSLRRVLPGLIAYEPPGALPGRVRAVAPYIEAGNVLLPGEGLARRRFEYWRKVASERDSWLPLADVVPDWVDRWIHEWAVFPKGANDDQVASGCQALERMAVGATSSAQVKAIAAEQARTPVSEAAAVAGRRF
jgi:hypothetical protein